MHITHHYAVLISLLSLKNICFTIYLRYVPAYSTRLKYESDTGMWKILPSNSSDTMDAEDPVWTESNWDTINIRTYKVQTNASDSVILLLGVVVMLLAYVLILMARTIIRKALKED